MPGVPILCYHRIEHPPAGHERDTNFVAPALFTRHVALLERWGFSGVTIADVLRWQRGEGPLPRRPVVLCFDDAYTSVADVAVPVLRRAGWTATIYAVTTHVGGWNDWDPQAPKAALLDADALRALADAGFEIGSHTRRHRRVTTLSGTEAADELDGSRYDLERMLGGRVESFAFPYGTHDLLAMARVAGAGYRGAVTLKRWRNDFRTNPLRLGRMSVGGPLPPWLLGLKMGKMLMTAARM